MADPEFVHRRLKALRSRHLYRQMSVLERGSEPWLRTGGREYLNLSSNNYLGLANRPELREAASQAALRFGWGTGASRLISGTSPVHERFENRFASFKGLSTGLLFGSGYMANLGIIQGLVGRGDIVIGDEFNHASIIDGVRLSGAQYHAYQHADVDGLEEALSAAEKTRPRSKKLVVTEAVFSMDGDIVNLSDLVKVCELYRAMLLVDEAHSTGCLGDGGRGLISQYKLEGNVTISMTTLSKAIGTIGGMAFASCEMRDYIVNSSRSFIYTTSLPHPVVAAADAALTILEQEPELVTKLQTNAEMVRVGLKSLGFDIRTSESQIIPIVVGSSERAIQFARYLRERGIYAVAIRPPTVPLGSSRVRLSIMATHTTPDLKWVLEVLDKTGRDAGLI